MEVVPSYLGLRTISALPFPVSYSVFTSYLLVRACIRVIRTNEYEFSAFRLR